MKKKILFIFIFIFFLLLMMSVQNCVYGKVYLSDMKGYKGKEEYRPIISKATSGCDYEIVDATNDDSETATLTISDKNIEKNYKKKGVLATQTAHVKFYIISDSKYNTTMLGNGVSLPMFDTEGESNVSIKTTNGQITGTRNVVASLFTDHMRCELDIEFFNAGSNRVLEFPVKLRNGNKFTVKIKTPNVIGKQGVADNTNKSIRSVLIGKGYITDKDSTKLKQEKDTGRVIKHRFLTTSNATAENLKSCADYFINSYGYTDKTSLFDYSETLEFKDWDEYDGGVKRAIVGFNFKVKSKSRALGRDQIGPSGKWITFFFEPDEGYCAIFDIVYITTTKEFLYKVNYGEEDDEGLRDFQEGEAEDTESDVDDLVDEYNDIITMMKTNISKVLGEKRKEVDYTDVLTNQDFYTPPDDLKTEDAQKVESVAGKIIAVITNVGIVLSIIIPAVLGVKYIMGSVEEKAEYKETLVPYFVGSVMLFGICLIVKIIQLLGDSINNI